MKYFELERISLTSLIVFVSGYIILFVLPLASAGAPLGELLVKSGTFLMIALGAVPIVGFFTSFFAYETSSKVALAVTHVVLFLVYCFFGFWVLLFSYAALANVY
ncbi:hypothetical protein [Terribacillus sp. DMT04]|uniref:hypothetical protein n=1 Tax=Terribacillus sp. DMT04 TaxID=2850441 RepID=UPI001C2C42D8|nr:hypothetical protein [Terribacillus sp. DMT04]QXE00598.1 hypothetical protein KS242_11255 [Terribacillus sp. DMT04]